MATLSIKWAFVGARREWDNICIQHWNESIYCKWRIWLKFWCLKIYLYLFFKLYIICDELWFTCSSFLNTVFIEHFKLMLFHFIVHSDIWWTNSHQNRQIHFRAEFKTLTINEIQEWTNAHRARCPQAHFNFGMFFSYIVWVPTSHSFQEKKKREGKQKQRK